MKTFSLENRPSNTTTFRKKALAHAVFITEPFIAQTQEGPIEYSPATCENWEGGYWLVYPDDGSKPYGWSPKFCRENMVAVTIGDVKPSLLDRIKCALGWHKWSWKLFAEDDVDRKHARLDCPPDTRCSSCKQRHG